MKARYWPCCWPGYDNVVIEVSAFCVQCPLSRERCRSHRDTFARSAYRRQSIRRSGHARSPIGKAVVHVGVTNIQMSSVSHASALKPRPGVMRKKAGRNRENPATELHHVCCAPFRRSPIIREAVDLNAVIHAAVAAITDAAGGALRRSTYPCLVGSGKNEPVLGRALHRLREAILATLRSCRRRGRYPPISSEARGYLVNRRLLHSAGIWACGL